ncbi:MAG: hypothetical protein M3Z13_05295 [Candidatus Dormibacteraeota bacterium]|nr:hypothetical protein [Candidatus Dormibacteraeota bacterium]
MLRQEVASAVLPGTVETLYVIGGFDSARTSTRSVEALRESWLAGPDYPLPIDHAAAATLGTRLFVSGGFSNGPARAEVFSFTEAGSWQAVAPLNHARGAHALVTLGDRLYAVGGRTGSEVAAVEMFNPALNSWTDVTSLPQPRDHVAGFAWQGRVCIAGGRSPNTSRVDCYDPTTGGWSRLADLPGATSGAGAAAFGDLILVAGGEDSAESRLVDRVFRYRAGAWNEEPMLVARHGIQLAVFRGRAWACGGAIVPGYRAVSDCTSMR